MRAGVGDRQSFYMFRQRVAQPSDAPGARGRVLARRLIFERKTSIASRGGERCGTRDRGATRVISCPVGLPGTARNTRSVGVTARQRVGDANSFKESQQGLSTASVQARLSPWRPRWGRCGHPDRRTARGSECERAPTRSRADAGRLATTRNLYELLRALGRPPPLATLSGGSGGWKLVAGLKLAEDSWGDAPRPSQQNNTGN